MYPEYSNSAFIRNASNNTGNNIVDVPFDIINNKNFYRFKVPPNCSGIQDLSLSTVIEVPKGMRELRDITLEVRFNGTTSTSLMIEVIDSTGTTIKNVTVPQYTTVTEYSLGNFDNGTFTQGSVFRIVITAFVSGNETINIGKLRVRVR
jgi:hypothetical protein